MSGRLRSKIGALAGAFGLVLTTVVVALPSHEYGQGFGGGTGGEASQRDR